MCVCVCVCEQIWLNKMESLLFGRFFFFSFKSPNVFFYVKILKFINDFCKEAIYDKLSTFSSYQNHYQGNVYIYFLIKAVWYLN